MIVMSWDSYIDNLIAQSKDSSGTAHIDRGCIIGLDGGAAWTTAGHACALKVSIAIQHPNLGIDDKASSV